MKQNLAALKKAMTRKKCNLVTERMACEDPLAALPCCDDGGSKFSGQVEKSQHPERNWKEVFRTAEELQMLGKDKRGYSKKRIRRPCHGGRMGLYGKAHEQLRKIREEEEAAKELLEAVPDRKQQLEDEVMERGGRLHFLL